MQMPRWAHGGLVAVQFKDPKYPLLWLITRSGGQSVPFSVPGAESTLIYDVDRGADGTIGISGSAVDAVNRAAGFVAWLSPNGSAVQVVRTGLYRPAMVTVAPDGTLWTVGTEPEALTRTAKLVPNAAVVRHFDRSGNILHRFVPQSAVQDELSLGRTRNTLRASKDRIAWYSVDGRYIEISLTGAVLVDLVAEPPKDEGKPQTGNISFALSDEGDAFLSVPYVVGSSGLLRYVTYVLDRSARAWTAVPLGGQAPRHNRGYIYGVDGSSLVVMSGKSLQFYKIGK
jgi:hypothetical protein